MRIATGHLHQSLLRDIQSGLSALSRAQQTAATGRRISQISDDPVAAAQILRGDRELGAIAQYRRTITSVQTRLDAEESTLNQITDLLTRAQELAVSQGTSSATTQSRAITALEVDRLIEQAISLGNTRLGNEFLFAGTITNAPPFQAGGIYTGDLVRREVEIGPGIRVPLTHSGQQLLVDSGVFSSLTALKTALETDSPDAIRASLSDLETSFNQVQGLLAEVGASSRRLEAAQESHLALESGVLLQRSELQDVPLEEATLQMVSLQTTLQAALLSANRVLTTSLANVL